MVFIRRFRKICYGHIEVDASNAKEAQREYNDGCFVEDVSECDYVFDIWEVK